MRHIQWMLIALLLSSQFNLALSQCNPDVTPPVAICDIGLIATLDQNGQVTLWASDFDNGSYDDCSTVDLYIEEGLPPSSNPPTTQSLDFGTSDIGLHDIVLWVVDQSGNSNSCFVSLEITNCQGTPNLACNDMVQIILDLNGTASIVPHMILEGGPYCYGNMGIDFANGGGFPGLPELLVDTSDIGTHIVQIFDAQTNNSCWGNVVIQSFPNGGCSPDITPPTCMPPANTSITKTAFDALGIDPQDEVQLTTHFGSPDADDNCGVEGILKATEVIDNGQCGPSKIIRSFVAFDSTGNFSQPCTQVIDIYNGWTIHLPEDFLPGDPFIDTLEIIDEDGGLFAVSYEDLVFDPDCDGNADKILRKWTAIKWCGPTPNTNIISIDRLDLDGDGKKGDGFNIRYGQDSIYLLENGLPTYSVGDLSLGIEYYQIIQFNYNDTLHFTLGGTVFHDDANDCTFDSTESTLAGWSVTITGLVSGNTQSTFTDNLGQYSFDLCTSDTLAEISLDVPFNYGQICGTTHTIQFTPGNSQVVVQNIPVNYDTLCPILWVDVATPFLRRCFENYYTVNYCNYSASTINDVHVEVQLDPFMSFISSEIAGTPLGGNLYSFDLGNVAAGECGDFKIHFDLDCAATLGATHCVDAHIYPDTLCPNSNTWTGANIEVSAVCENDTVFLSVKNTGTSAMVGPLEYIVVEDVIMFINESFNLGPNDTHPLDPIPANGATYRIEAPQEPGHPYPGIVAAAVEGCNGINIFGLVNLFPLENPNPFIASDCQQNIGSFDPNDKQAFPTGYGNEHFIERNTDIDYLIRFQNTGTDTAFKVVIIDDLDVAINPASIRPGASSHDYQFELINGNTLRFTFHDIMLPDSNVNEPASHGFVKFKASQMADLPLGTVIENEAAIYFDFNDPVITNTVFHTIGEHFIEVINDTNERPASLGDLLTYPNPSFGDVTFNIPTTTPAEAVFILHDALGKQLVVEPFSASSTYRFERGGLAPGVYFYKVEIEGLGSYAGKLILK